MDTVTYITIADAYRNDPVGLHNLIKKSVHDAASDVGSAVVIQAFCTPPTYIKEEVLAA